MFLLPLRGDSEGRELGLEVFQDGQEGHRGERCLQCLLAAGVGVSFPVEGKRRCSVE